MSEVINSIQEAFESNRDVQRAQQMKAYMKDHFEFLGISSPQRKILFSNIWKEHKSSILGDWRSLSKALWEMPYREYEMIAMEIIAKAKKDYQVEDFELLEYFVITKSWWDTVDFLASHMAGTLMLGFQGQRSTYNEKWISSSNMWLNRTALLYQLKYKDDTDFAELCDNIRLHIGSKEFFINKACGWALRQYSKFNPDAVSEFLNQTKGLSNLTIREASKYL